ncbi:sulfite exporter TauE/SafE family protein [Devosia aquimaris]|uniref:sulfite exporter TauE/SafE family protein n=1 Tax=Devosia aquimaris TaxID=2866214 RepID=UPI001CD18E47|nr:sulfite exporter TauE/SafE family protein [Devosia sp. CJK-A8-3]
MLASAVIWGLTLGLASSLHCAGMCGPIGCTLMMLGPAPQDKASVALRLGLLQLGRISAYALAGLAFGVFGAGLYGQFNLTAAHGALQVVAAAVIVWMGLTTAGLVPSLALADRALAPVAATMSRWRSSPVLGTPEMAIVAGLAWGATPCAMVYTALFNSLLTGDPLFGAALMLSFGLGTVPAVVASTLAFYGSGRARRRPGRLVAGATLILGGILGLLLTAPGSPFCITGA